MSETEEEAPIRLVVGHKRDGRCVYSREAKKALVEMALRPGVSVSKLARQHDMNANVLRKWITDSLGRQKSAARQGDTGGLVPVTVEDVPAPAKRERPVLGISFIEIEIDGATLRVHGPINAAQLRMVMDSVRRR